MIAAFLSKFLPNALFFPQMASLETPRLTMFEAGCEKGLLSREVIRCSRSLLFFLPSLPPPSTSERARRRLKGRLVGTGADIGLSKENLRVGPTENVKENVSLTDPVSQYT